MKVILLLLSLFAVSSFASENNLETAQKVCTDLFQTSDQNKCFAVIKGVKYFNSEAIKICADLFRAEDKISCMKSIGDQEYTDTVLKSCSDKFQTKDKIDCLDSRGVKKENTKKERNNELDRNFIRNNLKKTLQLLEDREYEKAKRLLDTTLESL